VKPTSQPILVELTGVLCAWLFAGILKITFVFAGRNDAIYQDKTGPWQVIGDKNEYPKYSQIS
jgi:hypothetical protein